MILHAETKPRSAVSQGYLGMVDAACPKEENWIGCPLLSVVGVRHPVRVGGVSLVTTCVMRYQLHFGDWLRTAASRCRSWMPAGCLPTGPLRFHTTSKLPVTMLTTEAAAGLDAERGDGLSYAICDCV